MLDGAVPSAASIGAQALGRLAARTGSVALATAPHERLVAMDGPLLSGQAMAVADMVPALLFAGGSVEVVVVGARADLVAAVQRRWLPGAVVAWGQPTDSALWEGRDEEAAYVCRRFACGLPARVPEALGVQPTGDAARRSSQCRPRARPAGGPLPPLRRDPVRGSLPEGRGITRVMRPRRALRPATTP